ncbi:sensor histidine kinase [Fictibacillus sp. WQ 8-8]|uniref:sensor histidine kinase n=2 Tax=unclassified Fictibacillus TaxID=2644029 RepID=UPI00210C9606|nr:sensor histidine kinase [Fictibacillus sp. WQ 8-8]MCQ6267295.1 sensor histidine kinase [Fictibacillus sp. WQ 8-8]
MKTIRSKLLLYFFVFVILFNVVSISIFFSSRSFLLEYDSRFKQFLLLNEISQTSDQLYDKANQYVVERNKKVITEFHKLRYKLNEKTGLLQKDQKGFDNIQLQTYVHMVQTLIQECELSIGFAIQDDIDQYSLHLKEARNTSSYLQDTTLSLIDLELTDYQSFYADLEKRNESFKWFTLFLFNTTVLLAIFFALWFSRGINKPVQILSKAASEVSAGKLDGKPVLIQSNDELKLLGETFNLMRKNIRQYISEIEEKSELDSLLKELELKHLQNQVNPHFLFNTLNTISRMAFFEQAEETSKLIHSVSTLLRYSLNDINQSVLLREEAKVVIEYFHIQQTRFSDRIAFHTKIDEDCTNILVPRLILQPIVENAFIHGVESMEDGGEIFLAIYTEGETIIAEVKDNGAGMPADALWKQTGSAHVGHSTGIGLENVMRRMALFYQSENLVKIHSTPGKGTSVKLIFPQKEAASVESNHSG